LKTVLLQMLQEGDALSETPFEIGTGLGPVDSGFALRAAIGVSITAVLDFTGLADMSASFLIIT